MDSEKHFHEVVYLPLDLCFYQAVLSLLVQHPSPSFCPEVRTRCAHLEVILNAKG